MLFILKRHAASFFVCGLLGTIIAVSITYVMPMQWSATMLIQIGQVGTAANLLVDPNNVIQRIKFPDFATQVLQSQNLSIDESISKRGAIIRETLTGTFVKKGSLLEMRVNGYSPEEAQENLSAAFQVLQNEHTALLIPSITKLKNNLADARASLKRIEDERIAILDPIKKANSAATIEHKFPESILLALMLKSNEEETLVIRDRISSLDEQLNPYRTFNTKATTAIYVPKRAISLQKKVVTMIGLLLGICIAGLWAFIRDDDLREILS
jgi:uncharacterized protein involved in exopolysaccharide biosynthesis